MRRLGVLFCSIILFVSLTGCNSIFGGTALRMLGMKFNSQIDMIEKCISIDLDDMTDSSVKTIYSYTDPQGNDLTIKYISLAGAGDLITSEFAESDNWSDFPYDESIENLLLSSGASEKYDFEGIEEGYYTISGVYENSDGFDFDRNNFDQWYAYEIGIWDANGETLYYISITRQ